MKWFNLIILVTNNQSDLINNEIESMADLSVQANGVDEDIRKIS